MAETNQAEPIVDPNTENPKVLAYAGGTLFVLGLLAAALAYFGANSVDRLDMVLYAAILLALGYPMLLYVRALKKIAALEQRLAELERRGSR